MKAYIFHGWGSASFDNWFPWLKAELQKKGFEVIVPDFPNSQDPVMEEWLKAAMKLSYDKDTVLVGHSLGSVLIMRVLEKIKKKIRSAYLVSAFDRSLGIAEIDNFFNLPFDYDKIKSNSAHLAVLNSDNDPFIRLGLAEHLSGVLGCKLAVFHDAGHLSAGPDNNLKFPELLEMIVKENANN